MNLSYIIEETLLMAGFTFIVGIAFAYALKLTTFFFSRLIARNDDPQKRPAATDACMIRTMQELAEYHFGNSGESSKEDGNMNGLYEFHHGKI